MLFENKENTSDSEFLDTEITISEKATVLQYLKEENTRTEKVRQGSQRQIEISDDEKKGYIGGEAIVMSFGSLCGQGLSETRGRKLSLLQEDPTLYNYNTELYKQLASCIKKTKPKYYKKTNTTIEAVGRMALTGAGGCLGYTISNNANLSKGDKYI